MTCDFKWIVSSIAHLPAAACTTSAQGSKLPLRRGGEVGQRALGVLMNFPVLSVRLCDIVGAAALEMALQLASKQFEGPATFIVVTGGKA